MLPHALPRLFARWLRLPALAVLLLAVLANPILAAVGDTHQAVRGTLGHLHDEVAHDAGTQASAGAVDTGDPAAPGLLDLLHALAHGAHCCGHLTAVLPGQWSALPALGSSALPSLRLLARESLRPSFPIRPPISL